MKQFDLQGNEYDIQIKEMLDNIPKTNNLVSAYGSININDLQKAINRLKKVPTYDELLKENNKQKEVLDNIKEYCNKQIKIAEENIIESKKWLEVEECHLAAKQDIHTGKLIKKENEKILELLEEIE